MSHIPIPALAGVTAWMGLCLLDWSAWRRLRKMTRADAAFLVTAAGVLTINSVLAVAVGCSIYGLRAIYAMGASAAHPRLAAGAIASLRVCENSSRL